MACVRKRRGKWVFDYHEATPTGLRRRTRSFAKKSDAEAAQDKHRREYRQARDLTVDPDITLYAYADRWLTQLTATCRRRTIDSYRGMLTVHIRPRFGTRKLRDISRGALKQALIDILHAPICAPGGRQIRAEHSRATVRVVLATVRALCSAAVDDGVLTANPAARLGKVLNLQPKAKARSNAVKKKAMTRAQLTTFLAAASTVATDRIALLFLLMARTGVRIGEALALRPEDVDLDRRRLRVERALADDGHLPEDVGPPKSEHAVRSVHLSQQLVAQLRRYLEVDRAADKLARGWRVMPEWLFYTDSGGLYDAHNVRRVFRRVLIAAGLPTHFSPHSLRHSFASILLSEGKPLVYVKEQLGHEDVTLTANTYGAWLPSEDTAVVDSLDDPHWHTGS